MDETQTQSNMTGDKSPLSTMLAVEAETKVIECLRDEISEVEPHVMSQKTKDALNNALDEAEKSLAGIKEKILVKESMAAQAAQIKSCHTGANLADPAGSTAANPLDQGLMGQGRHGGGGYDRPSPFEPVMPFSQLTWNEKVERLRDVVKRQQETISWHSRRLEELSKEFTRLRSNLRDHSHSGRMVVVPVERYEEGDKVTWKVTWGHRDMTPEEATSDYI